MKNVQRKILERVPSELAEDYIWSDPVEFLIGVHRQCSFNDMPVDNCINLVLLDEEDFQYIDNDLNPDFGDCAGEAINMTPKTARALGEALMRAADAVEKRGFWSSK